MLDHFPSGKSSTSRNQVFSVVFFLYTLKTGVNPEFDFHLNKNVFFKAFIALLTIGFSFMIKPTMPTLLIKIVFEIAFVSF
jgi:hypothetical protein